MRFRQLPYVAAALLLLTATSASAQIFESVGIRAQGMGGAFVAVADDATATWWNPAGLASGAYFNAVVERGWLDKPNDDSTLGVSVAVPSLGVSFYRVRVSAVPSTGPVPADRQDVGTVPPPTFVISQLGATVGQSVGEHLVLASTLSLVRADNTSADIDLGAMFKFGRLRIGAVLKHLHAPDVMADGERVGFERQARVGAAYVKATGSLRVNAGVDADLTTQTTAFGDVRHLAGGGEAWLGQRLGVRAGISVNTVDDARPAGSVGASVAVQRGLFIDARLTRGDDEAVRGWGLDARVTF